MRASLVLVLFASACALPEDTYFVSGEAAPLSEVRLLRNRYGSKSRCDALEKIDTVTTGADGRFSFPVVRQQISGGENERRFFSVEFGNTPTRIWRFWFPDADLELGPWKQPGGELQAEAQIDGYVAWRGTGVPFSSVFDRDVQQRWITHGFEWKEVPIDSLGRVDYVPLETRTETDWSAVEINAREAPRSRGVECPFIDVKPCPLTDGRFMPFTFPPDSRTLVFKFAHDMAIRGVLFHGLVLARPAERVRYDFNFVVDYEQWNPWLSAKLNVVEQDRESEHCIAPGTSLASDANGVRPIIFRVRFEDAEGNLVPIVSMQEISFP